MSEPGMTGVDRAGEPTVLHTKTTVFPPGADPEDRNAHMFMLTVEWRGDGKWRVAKHGGYDELSRAGKWKTCPQPFQRRQYRFDSYEQALAAALKALPEVRVMDLTWPQFAERVKAKRAAS